MSSPDDEALYRQQLKIREMERKANFEQSQNEMRRQKDSLQHLRRENKELRQALQQSSKGGKSSSDAFNRKEVELLQTQIFAQRRTLDDLRSANDTNAKELSTIAEKVDELSREGQPILSDDSMMAQKIRTLENRLDKSLIKHNEAMAIRRTYEQILKRLRDERVGFDNQLAAIEKTLKAKEHDFVELKNMAHDAQHNKEIAKAEVQQFKAAYAEERRIKKKELDDRKAYVQTRMDQTIKQEKANKQKKKEQDDGQGSPDGKGNDDERRKKELMQSTADLRTEEEEERLQQYAEAYRKIKDVTRATNVDEVVAKFIAQEDTHRTLVDMTREAQAKIDSLQTQASELRRKVDEAKYSGSGQLGSRRIVDEFETHLSEAKTQLQKEQVNNEKTYRQFVSVKAGVEHLAEKLSLYRPEMQAAPISDENIVEVLKHCEQKLQMLVDEANASSESTGDALQVAEVDLPQHNDRVKEAGRMDDEDEDKRLDGRGEGEDGEEDPHDRVALKQMSLSAVERENQKARKKRRNKKEGEEA